MTKKEIRAVFKQKRLALGQETYDALNTQIAQRFFEYLHLNSIRVIHSYLSTVSQREVDTFAILSKLRDLKPDLKIQVPVLKEGHMVSVLYDSEDSLKANAFGILEPQHGTCSEEIPDMVITPLLAFDLKGYRVGYGGGYYDRYFAQLPANVLKVGLSFFTSVEGIDDLDEFDIPLDFCITPDRLYEFEFGY
jgi:5-formyltetrahydrofolate cyclo-ligase